MHFHLPLLYIFSITFCDLVNDALFGSDRNAVCHNQITWYINCLFHILALIFPYFMGPAIESLGTVAFIPLIVCLLLPEQGFAASWLHDNFLPPVFRELWIAATETIGVPFLILLHSMWRLGARSGWNVIPSELLGGNFICC